MAPHSSTLAWKIPWTEEPGRLQSMGRWESDMTERLHFHFSHSYIGEGNGNPLQCSCLENPRDGGAWCAAIYGVAQSRTWLTWLSSSSSSIQGIFLTHGSNPHLPCVPHWQAGSWQLGPPGRPIFRYHRGTSSTSFSSVLNKLQILASIHAQCKCEFYGNLFLK